MVSSVASIVDNAPFVGTRSVRRPEARAFEDVYARYYRFVCNGLRRLVQG